MGGPVHDRLMWVALAQLDIIVGQMKLDDQFEWDIDNSSASPEMFAEVYARELTARRLPVPRQLRDDLRLQRGIQRHPQASGWHRHGGLL